MFSFWLNDLYVIFFLHLIFNNVGFFFFACLPLSPWPKVRVKEREKGLTAIPYSWLSNYIQLIVYVFDVGFILLLFSNNNNIEIKMVRFSVVSLSLSLCTFFHLHTYKKLSPFSTCATNISWQVIHMPV